MLRTIVVGTCVSVQGEFVALLANGEIVIRDGGRTYRGRPVPPATHGKALLALDAAR